MTLQEQLAKKKLARNARQLGNYHFARSLGFKSDEANILMNRSRDNIKREAIDCKLIPPDTATPKNGITAISKKDACWRQDGIIDVTNEEPKTRHGGTFDKELHDRHMGGNE